MSEGQGLSLPGLLSALFFVSVDFAPGCFPALCSADLGRNAALLFCFSLAELGGNLDFFFLLEGFDVFSATPSVGIGWFSSGEHSLSSANKPFVGNFSGENSLSSVDLSGVAHPRDCASPRCFMGKTLPLRRFDGITFTLVTTWLVSYFAPTGLPLSPFQPKVFSNESFTLLGNFVSSRRTKVSAHQFLVVYSSQHPLSRRFLKKGGYILPRPLRT